jgi:M6 family metalloprotease-like protein
MASAQPVSECKIKPSIQQHVSLGFPVNPERLSKITNPKILVIPYRLKDEYLFDFGSKEKEIFSRVSENIYNLSAGRSKVTFVYNIIINLDMTVKERNSITAPSNSYTEWQERYERSTWGFMKKFIIDHDKTIDFSGIDGVILFSKSSVVSAENAEAMMMTIDLYGPWFNPIATAEGQISNVAVLYNQKSESTITHEVMHLFGLSDLYGSGNSARNSLMSDGVIGLLAWEKWVLGWLGDENIQCVSETNDIKLDSVDNIFSLDYSNRDQLLVIPTGTKTALVIDLVTINSLSYISYYTLDNDARPPITAFNSNNYSLSTEVTGRLGVGTYIESSKYTLLIKDNNGQKLSLNLIPKSLSGSASAKQLIAVAENTRIAYVKQEADAKAAADKAAAATKKTTITCVKGKLTKKVTAVKPVCPKGYKKK